MKRLARHLVGIDHGEALLFSDFEDGGPMWSGEGPRLARREIAFSEAFAEPPVVQVWLSMWDIGHGQNIRADVQAEDVTSAGFVIAFRTWGDTRIARVRASWQATGALRDEDEWDLGP